MLALSRALYIAFSYSDSDSSGKLTFVSESFINNVCGFDNFHFVAFEHSDKKSDCASVALPLCGIALKIHSPKKKSGSKLLFSFSVYIFVIETHLTEIIIYFCNIFILVLSNKFTILNYDILHEQRSEKCAIKWYNVIAQKS